MECPKKCKLKLKKKCCHLFYHTGDGDDSDKDNDNDNEIKVDYNHDDTNMNVDDVQDNFNTLSKRDKMYSTNLDNQKKKKMKVQGDEIGVLATSDDELTHLEIPSEVTTSPCTPVKILHKKFFR